MNRILVPSFEWALISLRSVARQPLTLVAIGVAIFVTGGGRFFTAFDFGESQGAFLLGVGWALQLGVLTIVALALSIHLTIQHESSGVIPVALARGISPVAIIVGSVLAVGVVCLVVALGSAAVVSATVGGGVSRGLCGSALVLTINGILIALVVQWLASFGRELGFIIGAALGLIGLGYLRSVAVDVGGIAAWFAMLVPDFAWLGELDWIKGNRDWTDALRVIASSLVYGVTLGWLAIRGMARREF